MNRDLQAIGSRFPVWALALAAVAIITGALVALALLGGDSLPERTGPPIEELAVERAELAPGEVALTVRNTGPDPVSVAQVAVNDGFVDFGPDDRKIERLGSERLLLDFPWQEGQPILISMLTSTGLVIEHSIPAAAETPRPDAGFFGLMTLLGTYVGIVPVILGMLFLPVIRRAGSDWVRFLIALTVGLLLFLAVDSTITAVELAGRSGGALGGTELAFLGIGLAFLALTALDRWLNIRRGDDGIEGTSSPFRLALLVAIGIGLHNLGEGLAIGSAYAIGELALGAFLVVGFAIHNTTEGLAIVAPLARERTSVPRLLGLGIVAGSPAIVGAIIGATVDNAELSAFLLGIGVGAIARVVVQLVPAVRGDSDRAIDPITAGGMAVGALALYVTGLLVAV